MKTCKDITVTISTKDRYFTSLYNCLKSITEQTLLPKSVILFDDSDNPIDITKEEKYVEILSDFKNNDIEFRLIEGERRGQVTNHQKALGIVDTEFIFRVDDDCVLDPDVLETLYHTFDDDTGAVGCLVLFKGNPIKKNPTASSKIEDVLFAENEQWYIPENYDIKEVDHLYSSFMFRKSAGKHGYNMSLSPIGASEETQFTYEMVLKGWKCLFNPNTTIWHHQNTEGGIRGNTTDENTYKDNRIFKNKLREWGVWSNYPQTGILCDGYKYSIDFHEGVRIQIFGEGDKEFDVQINSQVDDFEVIYQNTVKSGNFVKISRAYYQPWEVFISDGDDLLVYYKLRLEHQNVVVVINSSALGDNLAWIPYVDEFRKTHNCKVYCAAFHNDLYKNEYPDIHFIDVSEETQSDEFLKEYMNNIGEQVYAIYFVGWKIPWDSTPIKDENGNIIKRIGISNPNENKKFPLQQTSSDVLGLPFKEIKPKITKSTWEKPIKENYVTLSEFSTGYAKHWNYPTVDSNMGWQKVVDWINDMGYKVMVISKEPTQLKNIIDHTGDHPIQQRINEIQHAAFHIGTSSGLSWLAWGLDRQVVLISGFTEPWFEFQENCVRVFPEGDDICTGCWHTYDPVKGKFDWCPRHMDFECTKSITPDMVIEKIKKELLVKRICVKRDCMNIFYSYKEECCGINCPKCGSKGSSIDMRTGEKIT